MTVTRYIPSGKVKARKLAADFAAGCGCQVATRRLSDHRQVSGRECAGKGLGDGRAVVERRREGVLGRQAVVGGVDLQPQGLGEPRGYRQVLERAPHHRATAEEIENRPVVP